MDPTSLFSGSDNFFKYLSLGGFLFIVISIVFPMQRTQELSLEVINWEKEVKMLNHEILELSKNTNQLEKDSKNYKSELNKLKIIRASGGAAGNSANNKMESIVEAYNSRLNSLEKVKNQVDIKNIIIDFNNSRIIMLREQAKTYKMISWILIITGLVFLIYGSVKWHCSTSDTDKIKSIEKKMKEKELAAL